MIKLQNTEIEKLSAITELTPIQVQRLISLRLIEEGRAIELLLLYDFRRIKRRKQFTVGQIIEAMIEKYKVSRYKVEKIIYHKKQKRFFCSKCGKEITKREHNRGNGKCDHCVALEIDF